MVRSDTYDVIATIKVRNKDGSVATHTESILCVGSLKKAVKKAKSYMIEKYVCKTGQSYKGVYVDAIWTGYICQ